MKADRTNYQAKRNLIFCAVILLSLMLAISDARKTFLVKLQHPTILAPKVTAYDTSWKLINIGNKYMLVVDNQVQVEVGFDFAQKQGYYKDKSVKHWAFRNNYYFKQEFVTHPSIKLDTIFNGELFIELVKFRANVFWEFVWFPDQDKACLQAGYSSDPMTFLLRSGFNLLQCYKILIKTFTQWDQWDFNKIRNSGLFDSCTASTSTTAQVFRWDFYDDTSDIDHTWTPEITFDTASPPAIDMANTPWCFTLPYYVE
ncbi:hypothetical protein FGO68_gene3308 [Halteria grandinella]|uniref:Uncharacterized protein n=1 Tax=Halteria grandinella TaxID=5974 RepID=A0A8J8P062_HALGN|nr:hypothetical protein FGO68_gene3308 [Halteria grandinella]